jgi:hypothetical protein
MAEMITINDDNYKQFISPVVDGQRMHGGMRGMWTQDPSGYKGFEDQSAIPSIPESEWDDRIDEIERNGTDLKTFCLDTQLEVLNQGRTNYCWCNGPAMALMILRMQQSYDEHRYAPASIAARLTNFRNVGGWGDKCVEGMMRIGINYIEDWGGNPNAIDRSLDTEESRAKAKLNLVLESFVCRTYADTVSCILAGIPVAVGFNWWSHLVCGIHVLKGSHDLVIANSWGETWSDRGFGTLSGRKKIPDGAIAIITAIPA